MTDRFERNQWLGCNSEIRNGRDGEWAGKTAPAHVDHIGERMAAVFKWHNLGTDMA
jgi:hypothetical protein